MIYSYEEIEKFPNYCEILVFYVARHVGLNMVVLDKNLKKKLMKELKKEEESSATDTDQNISTAFYWLLL